MDNIITETAMTYAIAGAPLIDEDPDGGMFCPKIRPDEMTLVISRIGQLTEATFRGYRQLHLGDVWYDARDRGRAVYQGADLDRLPAPLTELMTGLLLQHNRRS